MTATTTRAETPSQAMKWWGWGDEGVAFTHDDKPDFGAVHRDKLGIDVERTSERPPAFGELDVPAPQLTGDLREALERAVGEAHVSDDPHDRVVHARGKSLRDLVRQRRGELGRVPDVVVRPGAEAEVAEVLRAALDADAVVIPFGGGTSISGSLEAPREETRTVVSVDLGPHGPAARDRRDLAARARAGRRLRAAPGGAAQRARLDLRALPRLLHPLDARRLDRDALLGHAVRPLRRHRRPHARAARGHARGAARRSARCRAPRPGRACARWCWAARGGWASSARRPCTSSACPRSARSSATCCRTGRRRSRP